MEKSAPYRDLSGTPGLSPCHALDILEVRARETQSELAERADAGDAVLQYLAQHGAPATRAAVAANIAAPPAVNCFLADDDDENVRVELAVKIARLMPGLSPEEGARIFALTVETLEYLANDSAVRVRAALSEEDQAPHQHPQECGARPGGRSGEDRCRTGAGIFPASVRRRPGRDHCLRPGA